MLMSLKNEQVPKIWRLQFKLHKTTTTLAGVTVRLSEQMLFIDHTIVVYDDR